VIGSPVSASTALATRSASRFDLPYVSRLLRGVSGTRSSSTVPRTIPYTATDETCTAWTTPAAAAASMTFLVASTLTAHTVSAFPPL
jgi:hypothetical protein